LPIPAPPDDFPNAAWLPARDVQLSEEWSRPPDEMEAGEPVTRVVTLSALGQIETQLPAIETPEVDGLNIYADKPELGRSLESGGIRGVRRDQYAIIGLAGGQLELPAVRVPWWDLEAGEWKVATLPARTLEIKGVQAPRPLEPPVAEATPVDAETPEPSATTTPEEAVAVVTFWQRATEILAVLWLLTLAAWWWSSRSRPRRPRAPREPKEPPVHKQQAQLLKRAGKSAVQSDAAEVRHALLEWGRLQWPDDTPRSIGELADRVEAPLSDELRKLSAVSYGKGAGDWDGAALADALRSVRIVAGHSAAVAREPLPPLMPPAA
jgi:hypothetical protein